MADTDIKKELYVLIENLQEEDLQEVKKLLEAYIEEKSTPYDDEPLTPEELEGIMEGLADIKAGRVYSEEEVYKEHGL